MRQIPINGSISELPNMAYLKKFTMYKIGLICEINCQSSGKIFIE